MATVWNAADISAHLALSNTDHTASLSGPATFTNEGVRSIGLTHATGKWYLEFTNVTSGGGSGQYGFAVAADTLGSPGQCGVTPGGSVNGGAGSVNLGSAPDGHTLCLAIDLDHSRLWARYDGGNWNADGSADPSTNTNGLDITGVSTPLYVYLWEQNIGAGSATLNAGDSAFVQTVPANFTPWDAPGFSGSFNAIETTDTFSAIGYSGIPGAHGDLLVTEAKDTFAAAGFQPNSGVLLTFETADHFSAFGFQPLTGTLAATEAHDVMHATGIGLGEDGVFITTEATDIFTAVGTTPISGSFNVTESTDHFLAFGAGVIRVNRRRAFIVA
jgi:hypothetical protein